MIKYRTSICIREEYEDVYRYLQTIDNASLYVCKLIRKDMANQSSGQLEHEEQIIHLIEKTINQKFKKINSTNNFRQFFIDEELDEVWESDKNLIKSIF